MCHITRVPNEIICKILESLRYDDIVAYCEAYHVSTIYNDTVFWIHKLDRDFGHVTRYGVYVVPSDYIKKYNHPNIHGIEIYKRWIHDLYNEASYKIWNKYNDTTIWRIQTSKYERNYEFEANCAAIYDNIELLEWFETQKIYPRTHGANNAALNGHLKVLRWLKIRNIYPDTSGANNAARNGHIKVLHWLSKQNILPDAEGANIACSHNRIHVLRWLKQSPGQNPKLRNIIPNVTGADNASENGHLNILKYLVTLNIFPSKYGANCAAKNGHLDILQWLKTYHIFPDTWGATMAFQHGHRTISLWLKQENILPILYHV